VKRHPDNPYLWVSLALFVLAVALLCGCGGKGPYERPEVDPTWSVVHPSGT